MVRGKARYNPRKGRRNNNRRPRPATIKYSGRMMGAQQNNRNRLLTTLKFGRTLLTGFPLPHAEVLKAIYNVFLSYVQFLSTTASYVGCICSFEVTPGCLLKESPLLAQLSQNEYSFPAIPVKIRYIKIRVTNTTQMGNRMGKWAAVYVPYRELHDAGKYSSTMKQLTFAELCQMPNARSGNCSQDLVINFRARDRGDYCARARELSEAVGILTVAWENYDRTDSDYSKAFNNTDFSCEFEISGTIDPLVVFGPTHRAKFSGSTFEPNPVTTGDKALTIFNDGRRFYGSEKELTEYLASIMEPGE